MSWAISDEVRAEPRYYRGTLCLAVLVLLWEVTVARGLVSGVPAPLAVAGSFWTELLRPTFWAFAGWSVRRVYGSFVLASVLGVSLGLLVGSSRRAANVLFPPFELLRPIPPIAWVPATILLLPTTEASIMFITFLGAFFPILLNTVEGVRELDEEYHRAARTLGADRFQAGVHVLLPGAAPAIFTGLVVGMGLGWMNLIAAEMIAGGTGLGYMTWSAYTTGAYPRIVVGMISIGLLGYASAALLRAVERRVLAWSDRHTQT